MEYIFYFRGYMINFREIICELSVEICKFVEL